jgi:malate synthase
MYQQLKEEEIEKIKKYVGDTQYVNGKFELAIQLFDKLVLNKEFVEFLTLPAYQYI